MPPDMSQAKQPVSAMLAGPYGHPFHPMLVTVPIGAWVTSFVFDVGSHVVDDPASLARGGMWLIAVGVLGALAAATVGFLDLLSIPVGTAAQRTALTHMSLMLVVTLAFAGNFWWRAASGVDGAVDTGQISLTAISLIVLTVAGALGGKLAYRYGVRVVDEATQADGFDRHD
ncbi:DUF2231 domain-containing protein [Gordonia sp. HY002]|uniref:DUF2231 domain-containing protein n=1 Tax=Gordonia zhenghanii TaxID=2911516 RepID=UPI001EF0811F|nr:DUF2231 domain-containing protein [Gordonia zhenghanii]MCF8571997.1 DUF2231 domain-containing protein [Gordonia zhenghanii]MCF8606628.1 DUF2231 domain-containing protein [Gordonia zhenghanii]